MINFFRLSKYILAFVVALIISAIIAASGLLRPIDLLVYKQFYLNSQSTSLIKDKITFINLPVNDANGDFLGVEFLRGEIVNLLNTIEVVANENEEPPIVVLDMTFSDNPLQLYEIKNAINRLIKEKGVKVYASYEMPKKGEPVSFQIHDAFQAKVLYDSAFTGKRLNTKFNTHGKGILSYDSFELIGSTPIPSLPVKVISDYSRRELNLNDSINYPLPISLPYNQENFIDKIFVFSNDASESGIRKFSKSDKSIKLSNQFIIVGLSDDIQLIEEQAVPGPFLVACALTDQLKGNQFTRKPHDNIAVQLATVLLFAIFVCLFFALLYKYAKQLQTKPHIVAILAFVFGFLLLIGFGYALLNYTIIRPSLPLLSMAWAALLAWHFTKKFLVTGIMEGGEIYDVFISYSHGDSKWVKEYLFNPLNEFKKSDGSKLKIFFDEKSIGIGELFTTKYMRSIVDSKLFVPVMSEEYYRKNHCRNEMDLAVKRHVEKLIGLCIIALDYKYVPEEFTHINYVDINNQTDFMTTLKKELIHEEEKELAKLSPIEKDGFNVQEQQQLEQKKEENTSKAKPKTKKEDQKQIKKKKNKHLDKKDKRETTEKYVQEADKKSKLDAEIKSKKEAKKKKKKPSKSDIDKQVLRSVKKYLDKKNKKKKKKKRSKKEADGPTKKTIKKHSKKNKKKKKT